MKLGELMPTSKATVDPRKTPDELFDLMSIPAFDAGQPEVVLGMDVGSSKQVLRPGDVVLSKIVPHIRRAGVIRKGSDRPIIGSSEWIVFRSDRFVPEYLRHVLTSDRFHEAFMGTVAGVGGSLLRARPAQVAEIAVPLPSLDEQRRIAAILDAADSLRARRQQSIVELDRLRRAAFRHAAHGARPIGVRYDSPAVEFVALGDVVEFLDHKRRPITAADRVPGPYPYFGANGQQDSVADYLFDEPLVLLAEDGGHFDDPDRGIAYPVSGKCWVNNHAHVLRPTQGIDWAFLAESLRHADVRPFITGTTRGKLTKSSASQIPIALPPLPIQRQFATRIEKVDQIRAALELALGRISVLFSSLQQRAFRGEL